MNLSYYLETRSGHDAKKPTPITLFVRCRVNVGGNSKTQTVKLSTGKKIVAKYWDSEGQRIKPSYTGATELNSWLTTKKSAADKLLLLAGINNEELTSTRIKEIVRPLFVGSSIVEDSALSVWDVYEIFIETRSTQMVNSTIQKYKTNLSHLKEFSKEYKYPITFETLDHKFLERFVTYLIKEKKHINNTIEKSVTILKTFLNWATDHEYNTKLAFRKFKHVKEQVDIVYLTDDELQRLYKLDLTGKEALQKVRDVFCFGCYTGQRFSDIAKISREQIKGNTWNVITKKTKDIIEVPLNRYALEILEKYKGDEKPLPVISNQRTNEHLKTICKDAKIDELIPVTKFRGAEKIEGVKSKYDLIGTHTARRTFVTLWLEKGGRPETCMEITGHKNYKDFKKYIKITSKVMRVEMDNIFGSTPVMKAV
ncbi:site-specific integrase [Pontibacter populi]|uniref:Site-specific integrase n=1 Tax=Pontibacter populi TaxID=890055 RepID=A0ABV1RP58_9BACT